MKRLLAALVVLAMIVSTMAAPTVRQLPELPLPPFGGPGEVCIQIVVCCEGADGIAYEASTPCACRNSGGTVLSRQPPACVTF